MAFEMGIANVKRILLGLYNKPGLRFHAYKLKESPSNDELRLIIWRGNELYEPIRITKKQLLECEQTENGYAGMESFLEQQIRKRLQAS